MKEKYSLEEIKEAMYSLDWIQIMQDAVETRPSSWGVKKGDEARAVDEWRNASDTLIRPTYQNLQAELKSSRKGGEGDNR